MFSTKTKTHHKITYNITYHRIHTGMKPNRGKALWHFTHRLLWRQKKVSPSNKRTHNWKLVILGNEYIRRVSYFRLHEHKRDNELICWRSTFKAPPDNYVDIGHCQRYGNSRMNNDAIVPVLYKDTVTVSGVSSCIQYINKMKLWR